MGDASGLAVGKFVGPLLGLADGEASGEVVGKSVGLLEGLTDGEASGLAVGEPADVRRVVEARGFGGTVRIETKIRDIVYIYIYI